MKIRLAGETDREYLARTRESNSLISVLWLQREAEKMLRNVSLFETRRKVTELYTNCGVERPPGGTVKVNIPKQYRPG